MIRIMKIKRGGKGKGKRREESGRKEEVGMGKKRKRGRNDRNDQNQVQGKGERGQDDKEEEVRRLSRGRTTQIIKIKLRVKGEREGRQGGGRG